MSYTNDAIRLNQLARGLLSMEEGVASLQSMPESAQESLLHVLTGMVHQAHPAQADVELAIERSRLRSTSTPCVLIRKDVKNFGRLKKLPRVEREKTFRLLLALLDVADERRRRTECASGCQHWWHRDLGDEAVVAELLAGPPL